MPSLVKIKVIEGREFPVNADAAVDSFVDIRLGAEQHQRTETIRKTLDPYWDEEFRFEIVDDSVLQNYPVEFRVMEQDLYSAKIIGAVFVDMNPLLMRTTGVSDKDLVIKGWFPLFDTFKGARGYLHIMVKLQFIGNDNPFRDSSAGVHFFSVSTLSRSAFIIQEV